MSVIKYINCLGGQAQTNCEKRTLTDVATDRTLPAMLRAKAITEIGASGDKTAASVLDRCFQDSSAVVKSAAYHALQILVEPGEKIFDVNKVQMKVPDKNTRLTISFWERLAAYARFEKITPDQLAQFKFAQSTGVNQEILGFLTQSDARVLKSYGIPVVQPLDNEEQMKVARSLDEQLAKGRFVVHKIFREIDPAPFRTLAGKVKNALHSINLELADEWRQLDLLLSMVDILKEDESGTLSNIKGAKDLFADLNKIDKRELRSTADGYLPEKDIKLLEKYKII